MGVAELPEPAAKRLQRPSWRNTRLLVGLVLILLGTAVGAKVVASADDTVPMYAAATTVRPGDHLTGDNLRRVDVQLGDEAARYLSARSLALQRVSVTPVTLDSGRFGASSSTTAVQLRVPRDQVAAVIGYVDKQARFTLVPVPGQGP